MALILALAIAWLYAEIIAGLGREWLSSPDASYGVVLVAVATVVAWQRRERCVRASRGRRRYEHAHARVHRDGRRRARRPVHRLQGPRSSRPVLIMPTRFAALATVLTLTTGCVGSEQAARDAVARGDDNVRAGRMSAAVIEYRNAVKRRPDWAEAYRKLGDAYAAQDNGGDAYRAYSAAIDLDPADTRSLVESGRLLFAAGRYSEALVRAEAALERNQRDTDAAVLDARVLATMNRTDEALERLAVTVKADPTPAVYAALGDVRAAAGDRNGAEAAFRTGVLHSPQSVEAHIALANFLVANGRRADAEAEYKTAIAMNASSEAANRALAALYISTGRRRDAEPYLRAAAMQPHQTLRSSLAFADYYLAAERYDQARRVLEPVTSGPMATDARVRLAAIAFRTGAAADARRLLDRVLKQRPTAEALTLNAQMLQAGHKTDEALAAARAAVEIDRSAVVAQYIVGSIELDRGHYDTAETAFQSVVRDRQWAPAGSLQLARVKLASGHPADAIAFAESAGDDFSARLTLARALIADGQVARARAELRRLASTDPHAPQPPILLGSLALTDGNLREARAQSEQALTLSPEGGEALLLAARTAAAEGDTSAAERYLARAAAGRSSPFAAHAMLAKLYTARGDLTRAQQTLEQYIGRNGDTASARTALGTVLQAANRFTEARAAYEQALTLDPGHPVASHNLARLYARDEAQVPRALELARTAVANMPDDADAHDTLGWIAFRAGRLSLAASELQRAVALNGCEPTYVNHLRAVREAVEQAARADDAEARARKAAASEQ
jgi:tetratricopeptide (TPR) repeat protein